MDTDLWLWDQLCFWRPAFFCQQKRTFFPARASLCIKKGKMRISHLCLLRTFVGCVVWEAASVAAAFAANIGTTFKWELCNCIFAQFVRICHPLSFESGCQEQHQGQKEKSAIFPFSLVLHFDLLIYALIQNPKHFFSSGFRVTLPCENMPENLFLCLWNWSQYNSLLDNDLKSSTHEMTRFEETNTNLRQKRNITDKWFTNNSFLLGKWRKHFLFQHVESVCIINNED